MTDRIFGGSALGVVASIFMMAGTNECLAEADDNFSVVAAEKGYSVLEFDSIEGVRAQSRIYEKFGMRIGDLEVYEDSSGNSKFIGVWEPGTGLYKIEVDSNWSDFESRWWTEAGGSTYRLKDVERVVSGGGGYIHYSVYRQGSGGSAMYAGNWSDFTSYWADVSANDGLRLIDVDVQGQGSSRSFVGTFAPGSDAYIFYATSSLSNFTTQFNNNKTSSMELVDVDIIRNSSGSQSYYGVWRSGGNQGELVTDVSYDDFKQDWGDKVEAGYELIDLDISKGDSLNSFQNFIASYRKVTAPDLSSFNPDAEAMGQRLETTFSSSNTAVGMSYAISRNGQIVKSGATGKALVAIAGSGIASDVSMTSDTRQAVMSVTKMMTAPLVHRLLRLRGLDTDAPVGDWLPSSWTSRGVGFDGTGVDITFKHLLTHTSGLTSGGTDWSQLMTVVQNGGTPIDPSVSQPTYSNINYALLRVVVPILRNGFAPQMPVDDPDGVSGPVNSWSAAWGGYQDYMEYLIADSFNIPITCASPDEEREAYAYKINPTIKGVDWAQAIFGLDDCGGHQGLRVSAQDSVRYWDRVRYDDTVVTEAERNRMRGGQGMQAFSIGNRPSNLRINSTTWHGVGHSGGLGWTTGSDGSGDASACLLEFPGDLTAMLIVNSSRNGVCSDLRNAYQIGLTGLTSFSSQVLQAENASMSGANVRSDFSGYTGSGFVDTINNSGNWVEFDVNNIPYSGIYRVAIRYSNGSSSNRPLDVSINGVVENSVDNPATGSWSSWNTANVNIPLVKGNNKVRLIGTSSNGAAMIDKITVSKVAISNSI